MTDLLPLRWVIETLTIWHYLAWAVVFSLSLWRGPRDKEALPLPDRIWAGFVMLPIVYTMGSLVVGQLFGDQYSWSQIWPSGIMLGALASSLFIPSLVGAIWLDSERRLEHGMLGLIGVPVASMFFGLFFSVVWWTFPLITGFGLIDFPKLSWGVQL